ncbi:hypothetical protein IC235_11095 [Hymenobacter sp. BT664]|uniref:Uncharacterized protein n=1 Tax=Hymenobacter montanus TaxID=2771359 RepID=A0A927BDL3_9BACT|nr:hypothetical protein [Hymenobacter montanus]MBD2768436.1 hypothetical protein [Hymenobacter montanus]
MATVQALEASGQRPGAKPGVNSLQAFELALADSPDARLRRLGFAALLAQSAQVAGWTNALRTRLDWYRRDPAPLVAAAAQFFFPPPKAETASVSLLIDLKNEGRVEAAFLARLGWENANYALWRIPDKKVGTLKGNFPCPNSPETQVFGAVFYTHFGHSVALWLPKQPLL